MIFYHGSAGSNVESILVSGIRPRYNREGNWSLNNVDGHKKLVYLTTMKAQAEYHSMHAAAIKGDNEAIIIQISGSDVKQSRLRVDENYIDMLQRDQWGNVAVETRNKSVIQALRDRRWRQSLKSSRLCSHVGPIKKINRIETYKVKDHPLYREHLWSPTSEYERKIEWDKTHKVYVAIQSYFIKSNQIFPDFNLWQALHLEDIRDRKFLPSTYAHLAIPWDDPIIKDRDRLEPIV